MAPPPSVLQYALRLLGTRSARRCGRRCYTFLRRCALGRVARPRFSRRPQSGRVATLGFMCVSIAAATAAASAFFLARVASTTFANEAAGTKFVDGRRLDHAAAGSLATAPISSDGVVSGDGERRLREADADDGRKFPAGHSHFCGFMDLLRRGWASLLDVAFGSGIAHPGTVSVSRADSLTRQRPLRVAVRSLPFEYDVHLARRMASLSEISYCGPLGAVENWTCAPCNDTDFGIVPGSVHFAATWAVHQKDSNFAFVARLRGGGILDGHCVLSLRGTEKMSNLVRDFEFRLVATPSTWCGNGTSCFLHDGAYSNWLDLSKQVMPYLTKLKCAQHGIVVTGHSIGASMATMAVYDLLVVRGLPVKLAYVFASPRVGDPNFVKAFIDRVSWSIPFFRINHASDPIVHLPPTMLGYQHVQFEIFYDSAGNMTVCEANEDSRCADGYLYPKFSDHCAVPVSYKGDICACPGYVALAHSNAQAAIVGVRRAEVGKKRPSSRQPLFT
eukprot:TRINITY_DN27941_c0_g1_i2.p1 TRINITY_DN27941_c0_g1~~TRINITY_DN27941_c0_g1_i2.p1  ORF type:complete len:520 (+),score=65.45 TRINITY_DN27941_c0_g1_i2:53-1561(+)